MPILGPVDSKSDNSPPALPGTGLDLQDAQVVAGLFHEAAEANLNCQYRRGSTEHLPGSGRLLMSGDLHDHGPNLMRLLRLARLASDKDRHLVLHEVIHGPHRVNGADLSIRTLARVAAMKRQYPDQVHFLLANHELAQLSGSEITKDGVGVIGAFEDGVDFIYGSDADDVRAGMRAFISTMPLAIRCSNGILCAHSLPSPRKLEFFDVSIVDRRMVEEDLRSGGSAHLMVWGRGHNDALAEVLAQAWKVKLFVVGHQPVEMGFETEGDSILILASNHDHGVVLPIDLSRDYDMSDLVADLIPLASVAV